MDTQKKGRVIITSSRNLMALVIARSLGQRNIEIIAADCINYTMVSMSKYVQKQEVYSNYLYHEEAFLNYLEEIIIKNKPSDGQPYLLIPVFTETLLIARNAKRFAKYIAIASPSIGSIEQIFPKHHFADTTKNLGIHTPETFLPKDKKELEQVLEQKELPLLIKPYNASGGRGIKKVRSKDELLEAFDNNVDTYNEPPLVQELAEGEDYCLTTLFREGELKACMAYKNLHQFPSGDGSGVMRETIDDKPFIDEAVKLLKPLKWNGIAQLDFMWTGDLQEKPYMIEVNTRFWAGLYQSVQSGIDYPWLLYLLYTGEAIPFQGKPNIGEKTKIPAVWVLSIIQESFSVNKSLNDIKDLGQEAFSEFTENRKLLKSIGTLFNKDMPGVQPPVDGKQFISKWQESRNAENEIFSNDDPKASLGIIYSLFYLAKYKEFPPEVGI